MCILKQQGSQFRKFRDFTLNVDHGDRPVGETQDECVGTSCATAESRIEPDAGSSVCPAPSPSMPRSYVRMHRWLLGQQQAAEQAHLLGAIVAK